MKKIKIEIASIEGHQELMMNEQETRELIEEKPEYWVFVDNKMVSREHVVSMDLGDATVVRLMPALVGGAGITQDEDKQDELIVGNNQFRDWRQDGIPGHNASLNWLMFICQDSNALIQMNPPEYGRSNKALIDLEGESGSLYRIEVEFNRPMADALATKLGWGNREYMWTNQTLDGDSVEVINPYVKDVQRLLDEITLYRISVQSYNFAKGYWNGVCIQPRQFPEHGADAAAAVVMALRDDMESARNHEMDTLRNSLIDTMLTNWIFHPRPKITFEEASDFIKEIVKIKKKSNPGQNNEVPFWMEEE